MASLSGPGGSTLRTFEFLTGDLILETQVYAPEPGHLFNPAHFDTHAAFSDHSEGLYVLSDGHVVTFVDGVTGEIRWTWSSPDHTYVDDLFRSFQRIYRCDVQLIDDVLQTCCHS